MDQQPLWTPALAAASVTMHYEWPYGWSLVIAERREGAQFGDSDPDRYDGLSSDELLDVVTVALSEALGLS
jgi:hypothetical protein